MARTRKKHVQLDLVAVVAKRDKNGQLRGGKRKGAGRPKKGERASERHKVRESFRENEPVHITLRAVKAAKPLRGFDIYRAVRNAMVKTYARARIRITHLSIQGTHIHLIVEAANRLELARGMQGFEIAAAKLINVAISQRAGRKRKGTVFPDRYHAVIIRTPRQARAALSYVLNNWRHHDAHTSRETQSWPVDPYSTAPSFRGFSDFDPDAVQLPVEYPRLPVWEPRSWLLKTGWRRHGLISRLETPGVPGAIAAREGTLRTRART